MRGIRERKIGAAVLLTIVAGGCAVVGPLYDRSMADAPHAACAAVNGPIMAEPGTEPGNSMDAGSGAAAGPRFPAQCFDLSVTEADGVTSSWGGELLTPVRTLIAIHRAVPGCTGKFTHLTVDGAARGPGRMELATWDLHGRPGHQRTIRWSDGFAHRSLVLADIGSALMNPAGARISVQEGAFDPRSVCFKS